MAGTSRETRVDVVGADGVVLLFQGKLTSVLESLEPSENLFDSYNYSLVTLRPSDLDDRERVRGKLVGALTSVVSGDLDPVFRRAAENLSRDGHTPEGIRATAARVVARYLESDEALDAFIREARATVERTHRLGVRPSADGKVDEFRDYLAGPNSPLTGGIERLLHAERIPIVLFGEGDDAIQRQRRGGSQIRRPSDAAAFVVAKPPPQGDPKARDHAAFSLNYLIIDDLVGGKIGLASNAELERLPGTDYQKARYELGRKRKDVSSYNRGARLPIHMFPGDEVAAFARANSTDPALVAMAKGLHDPACALAEAHHLLTNYPGEPERRKIRDRFEHVIRYHDAAMAFLDRKIEERLHESRLPAFETQHLPPDRIADRTPVTPEAAIARADRFARAQLPSHHRLRVLLQPTPDHPIVLKLTDGAGHTSESVITTHEPDANRALDIKCRVQAHLLDIPGIVPYRGPMRDGGYHVGQDEFIPADPARQRLTPKYGEYRLKLGWERPREELSISLGLNYSSDNREEAERRAEFVRERLERARGERHGDGHLPLTKRDLADALRAHVRARGGAWHELTHGQVDHFPAALRFPFGDGRNGQESWLHVEPLQTDGNPNYTWVLPLHVVVDGQRLANASTHVNLHVRDRRAAEERAIEAVNHMMHLVAGLPPGARWAVDAGHPNSLQSLSEAARDAAPHLIDTNRLKDFQNELRFPYKRDLTVRLTRPPAEEAGRLRFTLGLFRGGEHGLSEPVLEAAGADAPPRPVERALSIPVAKSHEIGRFAEAVGETFRATIGEEYDPRSPRNYDREAMRKLKTPRPFKPGYAPRAMDDAIRTHLGAFPGMVPDSPLLAPRRLRAADGEDRGFVDRINVRGWGPGTPG